MKSKRDEIFRQTADTIDEHNHFFPPTAASSMPPKPTCIRGI
jgi:hypothetical protein